MRTLTGRSKVAKERFFFSLFMRSSASLRLCGRTAFLFCVFHSSLCISARVTSFSSRPLAYVRSRPACMRRLTGRAKLAKERFCFPLFLIYASLCVPASLREDCFSVPYFRIRLSPIGHCIDLLSSLITHYPSPGLIPASLREDRFSVPYFVFIRQLSAYCIELLGLLSSLITHYRVSSLRLCGRQSFSIPRSAFPVPRSSPDTCPSLTGRRDGSLHTKILR